MGRPGRRGHPGIGDQGSPGFLILGEPPFLHHVRELYWDQRNCPLMGCIPGSDLRSAANMQQHLHAPLGQPPGTAMASPRSDALGGSHGFASRARVQIQRRACTLRRIGREEVGVDGRERGSPDPENGCAKGASGSVLVAGARHRDIMMYRLEPSPKPLVKEVINHEAPPPIPRFTGCSRRSQRHSDRFVARRGVGAATGRSTGTKKEPTH